ncbi:PQQ-dependent sugar dehydrogenase [Gammaproteobacteria bacterium]|jgi:glucose/arabinose dehydrogenase|nr:PQQ-dependent sugar dehydrogenase [bacterium]MDA9783431.1 PQQ-dependent sugar dehydrogenase [Gammaproteobacteria bacterium]MDB2375113.1 PQQ-dependent sugar dehydrogenase [Gammaproteobacteria bacterium]
MHNSSRLSTLFKKLSFSFFILLSLELTSIGTDKIYAAIEPTLTFEALYAEQCAVCHGSELQGEAIGVPLVGLDLLHGDSLEELAISIADGFPESGMPAWSETLSTNQIRTLAVFIVEQRDSMPNGVFNTLTPIQFPAGVVASEKHSFTAVPVVDGLEELIFSMAILPDRQFLVTEKTRGLRLISADGQQSTMIQGTPKAYHNDDNPRGGVGWMLEVVLHPEYADNGWIYLHFSDRCEDCNTYSRQFKRPASMNKVVRGRIEGDQWVDQETIIEFDFESYQIGSDIGAGGRVAFDQEGHLFFSIGARSPNTMSGVQDLALPWGKIHRVNLDGSIPEDNPYVGDVSALDSIWSRGHRSPQGLEINPLNGDLWSTEMGPRGGDELNIIGPGNNYGWPLHSLGINYSGTEVNYGRDELEYFDIDDIEMPLVDFTPSPAVSSFIFYQGDAFPEWKNDILMGTLKSMQLFRFSFDGNRVIEQEILLDDFARVRDIESGIDGEVYLLLENGAGSKIARLMPMPVEVAK